MSTLSPRHDYEVSLECYHVPHEFRAERLKMLDILIDDLLRQAVLGDSVAEDAERVQRLDQ